MIKFKIFSKKETLSLIIIFGVLIIVLIPNFIVSLRRARDQVRRDDLGALVHSLDEYRIKFDVFPPSSADGKIMDCLNPGDKPYKDEKDQWVINAIPCQWGVDAFLDLIDGRVYMRLLPRDPKWQEGASYLYLSDGERYQIYAFMEGENEPEVDEVVIKQNQPCGSKVCNVGRSYHCDIPKTLAECKIEADLLKK
jgi:hypothetical protein